MLEAGPFCYRNTTTRGAASEAIACAWFTAQGYDVFRAFSSSCPVDLVVWRDSTEPKLVEVKSATVSLSPQRGEILRQTFSVPSNRAWDYLAVVDPAGGVVVFEASDGTNAELLKLYGAMYPPRILRAPDESDVARKTRKTPGESRLRLDAIS